MLKISNLKLEKIAIKEFFKKEISHLKITQILRFSHQLMNKPKRIEIPQETKFQQVDFQTIVPTISSIATNQLVFCRVGACSKKENKIFNNSNNKKYNSLFSICKFKFSTSNSKNFNEIKEKLKNEGKVKLYDSKYTFNSEKLMVHGSLIFLVISSSTIILTNVSLWLKLINVFFVLVPSLLVQLEYFINNTRFIKSLILLNHNKVQLTDMWGKNETVEIKNLIKASEDPRLKNYYQSLNHQTFIIFTNKANKAVYHCPRDGVYWDEGIFHDIIEGKQIE